MKLKDFLRSVILIVALSAFGISSGVASDKNEAKHSSKITKARAERIALTKVPGGSIRSAELETARGRRFWSVYIAKPGSKNGILRSFRGKLIGLPRGCSRPVARAIALRYARSGQAGINGLHPTSWVPSIYSVSLLIRLRYALER